MEFENKKFEKKSIEYDYEKDIIRINIILDHRMLFHQMKKSFINANPNDVTITTTQAPRLQKIMFLQIDF